MSNTMAGVGSGHRTSLAQGGQYLQPFLNSSDCFSREQMNGVAILRAGSRKYVCVGGRGFT